jgi:hypothetical protein
MKDNEDPRRLRAEHRRREHPHTARAYCPECEPVIKARRAKWQAIHEAPGHDCPECEEDRQIWTDHKGTVEHMRGEHETSVPECESCQLQLERARDIAAHGRGEHESFDYTGKHAVAPCSECRTAQWSWYENLASFGEKDVDGVATGSQNHWGST